MSCYHPNWAYISSRFINTSTGKGKVFFLPNDFQPKVAPDGVKYVYCDPLTGEVVTPFRIPCGQCVGCRLDYSRVWANRCVMESLMYDDSSCWFLTLTYENPPVSHPRKMQFDDDSGLPLGYIEDTSVDVYTLLPKDVQDFMKRLRINYERKYNHSGVRFYLCGEYGDNTFRPHYHVILFNAPIPDLVFFAKNRQGDILYNSDFIQDTWSHGYAVLGACTWHTCAYTARYVMKKVKGKIAVQAFRDSGLELEFVRMSRRPGIGVPYFEKYMEDIYRPVNVDGLELPVASGKIVLPGGLSVSSCRLFDDKYSSIDTDKALSIALLRSHRRIVAESMDEERKRATSLCDEEYFSLKECEKQKIAKFLEGIF